MHGVTRHARSRGEKSGAAAMSGGLGEQVSRIVGRRSHDFDCGEPRWRRKSVHPVTHCANQAPMKMIPGRRSPSSRASLDRAQRSNLAPPSDAPGD